MILTDSGPLVAILDRADQRHDECVSVTRQIPKTSLLTTWPCFTEAIYLLGKVGQWMYQSRLWRMRQAGSLVLHDLSLTEIVRSEALMKQYRDRPMDLADASLIAVAESLGLGEIFTIDSDFHMYRLANGNTLHLLPG